MCSNIVAKLIFYVESTNRQMEKTGIFVTKREHSKFVLEIMDLPYFQKLTRLLPRHS